MFINVFSWGSSNTQPAEPRDVCTVCAAVVYLRSSCARWLASVILVSLDSPYGTKRLSCFHVRPIIRLHLKPLRLTIISQTLDKIVKISKFHFDVKASNVYGLSIDLNVSCVTVFDINALVMSRMSVTDGTSSEVMLVTEWDSIMIVIMCPWFSGHVSI